MQNPTTVRLDKEQEEQVKKMAVLYGTQSAVFSRAIAVLWAHVGGSAEEAWAIVKVQREGSEFKPYVDAQGNEHAEY